MPARRPLHIVVAVWGERYIDCFLSVALPSFLADGNIPGCARWADVSFFLYTRPEDAAAVQAALAQTRLSEFAHVAVDPLLSAEKFAGKNRYDSMALCHARAIERATAQGATLCVLSPDCIVSDGSLERGLQRLDQGAKAVLVAGPRATLDTVRPLLERVHGGGHGRVMAIRSRALVGLLAAHPHPISQILFWDTPTFTAFPSAIYWHAGTQSILTKYFHLHPLFVDLAGAPEKASRCGTIDGALISMAEIPPERIHVVTNSDEIAVVELSALAHDGMGSVPKPTPSRLGRMIVWTSRYADATHRQQFVTFDIAFQGDEEIDWGGAIRRAHFQIWPLLLAIRLMPAIDAARRGNARLRQAARSAVHLLYCLARSSRG